MKGKKALFFTILGIVFIEIFLISYQSKIEYEQTNRFYSINSRINLINDFIESFEQDAQRGLYISGSRAMMSLNNYVISTFQPLNDPGGVSKYYNETIINGTIDGWDNYTLLMDDNTLTDWLARMDSLAERVDLTIDLSYSNITIEQASPYSLKSSMDITYLLNDTKGTAYWNRSTTISTEIPLLGWQDPYYSINTGGAMRQIIPTNLTGWDSSVTKGFIAQKSYRSSNRAPSFLSRLENKTQSDQYGIYTMLNLSSLPFSDYNNTYNLSVIDFYYINQSNISNAKMVNMDEEWFRLDQDFANEFGLVNSTNYIYPNYD